MYWTDCTKVPASVTSTPKSAPDASLDLLLSPPEEDKPTSTTATPMRPTPAHMLGLSASRRMKCFISATKMMPPPRRSIHTDAAVCRRPSTIRHVAARSKIDGMASMRYVSVVTLGSVAI